MKTSRTLILLCFCSTLVHAQITTATIRAGFGIDAELKSNFFNIASSGTDDWFSDGTAGVGRFVIDTTGAAAWMNLYAADVNMRRKTFVKNMSYPIYSVINGNLWYDAIFARDHQVVDTTAFLISNKNGQSPALWFGGTQPVPMKNDLKDVMVHVRRDGPNLSDSLYFFGALSLEGNTGNRYFDFELYQTEMYYIPASGSFQNIGPNAGHTAWQFDAAGNVSQPGDIIFSAEFSATSLTLLEARIWVHNSVFALTPNPVGFSWGGAFDGADLFANYGYAGIVPKGGGPFYSGLQNTPTWAGPFGNINLTSINASYDDRQYMEIAVNLTKLGLDPHFITGFSGACGLPFKRLFAKTRAATAFTSELKDFVGPYAFAQPGATIAGGDLSYFCGSTYQVSTLSVTNPVPTSNYQWTTPNGNILTDPNSTTIVVDREGTYIVAQRLMPGCEIYSRDTFVIQRLANCALLEQRRQPAQVKKAAEISFYPNPVTTKLQVQLPRGVVHGHMKMYNSQGLLVKEQSFRGSEFSILTSDLPKGIYFISMETDQHPRLTSRFLKE